MLAAPPIQKQQKAAKTATIESVLLEKDFRVYGSFLHMDYDQSV